MRASASGTVCRVVVGLSVAGFAAASGCRSPEPKTEIAFQATAGGRPQRRPCGPLEEKKCCEQHFPSDHHAQAVCLSEAVRHRGICAAPVCCPPPDGGAGQDAGAVDAGMNSDGSPDAPGTDGGSPRDAAGGDAGVPPVCPTQITLLSATPEQIGAFSGWNVTVQADPAATVTWTPTSSNSTFTLLETSGPSVDVECQGVGIVSLNVAVAGPGTCFVMQSVFVGTCLATCGNGIVEQGEVCDPPDGVTCSSQCQSLTCGDGVLETGEACDRVSSTFCQNCQFTGCHQCVAALMRDLGGGDPCLTTTGSQQIACLALEDCMWTHESRCVELGLPGCFCSDDACSAGVNGFCGRQLEDFVGTTDPAQIAAAAASPEIVHFSNALHAGISCFSNRACL